MKKMNQLARKIVRTYACVSGECYTNNLSRFQNGLAKPVKLFFDFFLRIDQFVGISRFNSSNQFWTRMSSGDAPSPRAALIIKKR